MRPLLATLAAVCLSFGAGRCVSVRSQLDILRLLPSAKKYAGEKFLPIPIVLELALRFGEPFASDIRLKWGLDALALLGYLVLGIMGSFYLLKKSESTILRFTFLALLNLVHKAGLMKQFVFSIDTQVVSKWLANRYPHYNVPLLIDYINSEYARVYSS